MHPSTVYDVSVNMHTLWQKKCVVLTRIPLLIRVVLNLYMAYLNRFSQYNLISFLTLPLFFSLYLDLTKLIWKWSFALNCVCQVCWSWLGKDYFCSSYFYDLSLKHSLCSSLIICRHTILVLLHLYLSPLAFNYKFYPLIDLGKV